MSIPRAAQPAPATDRPITTDHTVLDNLTLTTIGGAGDLLAADLDGLPGSAAVRQDGAAVHCRINTTLDRLIAVRSYQTAAVVLDRSTPAAPSLTAVLRSLREGVLSAADFSAPLRFRIGSPDPRRRAILIDFIRTNTDWVNDPGHWDLNITRQDQSWIAEVGFLHYSHRVGRLERQPWSTNPVLAEILIRMAKIAPNQRVHDPFCGTGTLLITAGHAAPALLLSGTDNHAATLAMAHSNLRHQAVTAILGLTDAIPFPHPDHSLDRVLSNLPFGKQVGSHALNTRLYPAVMAEVARTLRPLGRAVLLTEDKQLLINTVARTGGIKIIRQRTLRYHGATPTAYVITRTRTTARSSRRVAAADR